MAGTPTSTFARNERRAFALLGHPIFVAAIALWLVNDHMLKARFGSPLTGKLSDVAGLIAFPIIVAALLSWFTHRPMLTAGFVTVLLYGSVNLFAGADATLEWVMNLFLTSRHTRDATDLLLIPVLAVPVMLWRSAGRRDLKLRKTWSHVLLGLGIATTVATSAGGWDTDPVAGTVLLTEDEPRVEIPIELTLDGEPAAASRAVSVYHSATFFGAGEGDPDASLTSKVVDRADDRDLIVIELSDTDWAPVEVAWQTSASTEGEVGNVFNPFDNGEDAQQPVLTVDAPPDTFGPEPIVTGLPTYPPLNPDLNASIFEFEVTVANDSPGLLIDTSVSTARADHTWSVATTDTMVAAATDDTTKVPVPDSCADFPCTFSVWVLAPDTFGESSVDLYGDVGVDVVVIEHELARSTETVALDTVMISGQTEISVPVTVQVATKPQGPVEQLTTFVQSSLSITPLFEMPESERVSIYERCCRPRQPSPITDSCCKWLLQGFVGQVEHEDLYSDDINLRHEGLADVVVNTHYFSLSPANDAALTTTVGQAIVESGR